MTMLIDNLSLLGATPAAWAMVAALGVMFLVALYSWRRCGSVCQIQAQELDAAEAERRAGGRYFAGPRFAMMMVTGGAATVAGLHFITHGVQPVLSFGLLLGGIFVMQTEPYRHQAREAELRVIAARDHSEERFETEVARLRFVHIRLMSVSLVLMFAAAGVLLAF